MHIIGIDPGISGAVAIIEHGGTVRVYDTPLLDGDYNVVSMSQIIGHYAHQFTGCHVYIEKVNAMPKQGVVSMFNFGRGYGMWLGIIGTLQIPHTKVTPQAWKKVMMEGIKDKDAARSRSLEIFPQMSDYLKLKKHVGRADAILIAEYGRRKQNA